MIPTSWKSPESGKPEEVIDLRSDTVTKPTREMREAMANAEVGDDVFGEDPTVARLEAMGAELMGKTSAVFVPSGTMGNLAAVLSHCQRGDEAILGNRAHTFLYEAGGIAALGGVHPYQLPNEPDGTIDLEAIKAAIRADDQHYPRSRLICLENTHNRCNGTPLTREYTKQVAELAHKRGLKLHIDGARIFNAAAALNVTPQELAGPADSVTFCLSKGLGAPAGSVLTGDEEFIKRARRIRKQLGGTMRQTGVLAAAGIVALETIAPRLKEDHQRAKALAIGLAKIPGFKVADENPPSNMVYLHLEKKGKRNAFILVGELLGQGIKVMAMEPHRIRMVLHFGIKDRDVERVIEIFKKLS